jgi:hypothetical protein
MQSNPAESRRAASIAAVLKNGGEPPQSKTPACLAMCPLRAKRLGQRLPSGAFGFSKHALNSDQRVERPAHLNGFGGHHGPGNRRKDNQTDVDRLTFRCCLFPNADELRLIGIGSHDKKQQTWP